MYSLSFEFLKLTPPPLHVKYSKIYIYKLFIILGISERKEKLTLNIFLYYKYLYDKI